MMLSAARQNPDGPTADVPPRQIQMKPLLSAALSASITLIILIGGLAPSVAAEPSFADFNRRAQAGERLNVVFFGASLTWGANASDPQLTSYRALIGQRLDAAYPKAHFQFWDAAIGGTDSRLGAFRLERDVLRRKPDLVFLDFSANDDISYADPEKLSSYEAIVRRLVQSARVPVVQVIFPFQWNVAQGNTEKMPRRTGHRAIAQAYRTAVGDAIELAQTRVRDQKTTLAELWPVDGVHPCDHGYELFADAAWSAFQDAVTKGLVCKAPDKMIYAATYMTSARARLATMPSLPSGWRAAKPSVSSSLFDMLMSRWLDDEAVASNVAPDRASAKAVAGKPSRQQPAAIRAQFHAGTVMLFGESTSSSGKYRVLVDDKPIKRKAADGSMIDQFDASEFAHRVNGTAYLVQIVAEGLDPDATHELRIEPTFADNADQELRLESICVAGGKADVKLLESIESESKINQP